MVSSFSGMEARITRLEKELRAKIGFKGEHHEHEKDEEEEVGRERVDLVTAKEDTEELEDLKRDEMMQGDETSSDGGIESGTDDISEK